VKSEISLDIGMHITLGTSLNVNCIVFMF